jgi:hypothetical protein
VSFWGNISKRELEKGEIRKRRKKRKIKRKLKIESVIKIQKGEEEG